MVYVGIKVFTRRHKRGDFLMNYILKCRPRHNTCHTECVVICILDSIPLNVIFLYIEGGAVASIFTGQKEIPDFSYIFKPFIIVYVHEPLTLGSPEPHISGGGKIVTPCERNDLVGITASYFFYLFICTGKYYNQFTGNLHQQGAQRIQASLQRCSPIRRKQGNTELYIHWALPPYPYAGIPVKQQNLQKDRSFLKIDRYVLSRQAFSFIYGFIYINTVYKRKRPSSGPALSEIVPVVITVTTEELPAVPDLPAQALPGKPEPGCCSSYKPSFPSPYLRRGYGIQLRSGSHSEHPGY